MKVMPNTIHLMRRLVNRPNWCNLRSTCPVSRVFGFDRGTPIDRVYIDDFLNMSRPASQATFLKLPRVSSLLLRIARKMFGMTNSRITPSLSANEYISEMDMFLHVVAQPWSPQRRFTRFIMSMCSDENVFFAKSDSY
jgi:hypothetical protein